VILPQGVQAALRWSLAEKACAEFGRTGEVLAMVKESAADARGVLRRTNMKPMGIADFDDAILVHGSEVDASWIIHGGYLG
jgi:hypothetical protein